MKIGYDKEELKNKIIELYYSTKKDNDFLDLNSEASSVEDNYIKEIRDELNNLLKNNYFSDNNDEYKKFEIAEVEDLSEDISEEETVDIELLNKVEQNVIGLLQYLRLEFYDSKEIKDFIVDVMLKEIKAKGINKKTEELLENIIKNMVDHEFNDLNNKKKLRKENLVRETNATFSNYIEFYLEEHKSNNTGKMTQFQVKTLKKYIYKKLKEEHLEKFKKENKLNFEELNFVDYIIKKIVEKMVNDYVTSNKLLKEESSIQKDFNNKNIKT